MSRRTAEPRTAILITLPADKDVSAIQLAAEDNGLTLDQLFSEIAAHLTIAIQQRKSHQASIWSLILGQDWFQVVADCQRSRIIRTYEHTHPALADAAKRERSRKRQHLRQEPS